MPRLDSITVDACHLWTQACVPVVSATFTASCYRDGLHACLWCKGSTRGGQDAVQAVDGAQHYEPAVRQQLLQRCRHREEAAERGHVLGAQLHALTAHQPHARSRGHPPHACYHMSSHGPSQPACKLKSTPDACTCPSSVNAWSCCVDGDNYGDSRGRKHTSGCAAIVRQNIRVINADAEVVEVAQQGVPLLPQLQASTGLREGLDALRATAHRSSTATSHH